MCSDERHCLTSFLRSLILPWRDQAASTVAQAFDDLYFVERAAQTQILAMSTGHPLRLLAPELIEQVASQTRHERFELGYIERHFAAQKHLLDTGGSIYRN